MTDTGPWVSACFLAPASLTPAQMCASYSYLARQQKLGGASPWRCARGGPTFNQVKKSKESRCDCEIHAVAKAQAPACSDDDTALSWPSTTDCYYSLHLSTHYKVITLWLTPGNCRVRKHWSGYNMTLVCWQKGMKTMRFSCFSPS